MRTPVASNALPTHLTICHVLAALRVSNAAAADKQAQDCKDVHSVHSLAFFVTLRGVVLRWPSGDQVGRCAALQPVVTGSVIRVVLQVGVPVSRQHWPRWGPYKCLLELMSCRRWSADDYVQTIGW